MIRLERNRATKPTEKITKASVGSVSVWKSPKCPSTDKCIKKAWYTMEYYSSIKNNEFMSFAGR
jgi:hypothetical protein